ncbi:hypothetical protein N9N28_16645, partial [Rubripirellula amarantea]|nr:hypothetical protein [Rubripirellula amarantea]
MNKQILSLIFVGTLTTLGVRFHDLRSTGEVFADDGLNDQALDQEESEILFARYIAPLLREKCFGCHGSDPDSVEGSLDVRSLAGIMEGGDSEEAAIVAGKAELSALYLAATRQSDDWTQMPPKESEQLSPQELDWLRDWI